MDGWDVELALIEDWLDEQDTKTVTLVMAAIDVLRERGPSLRRPLVGTIAGSRIPNLKELIPGSSGKAEIRILFVFDPQRRAVMLLAGDKHKHWRRWYETAVPEAERRYDRYLRDLQETKQ